VFPAAASAANSSGESMVAIRLGRAAHDNNLPRR